MSERGLFLVQIRETTHNRKETESRRDSIARFICARATQASCVPIIHCQDIRNTENQDNRCLKNEQIGEKHGEKAGQPWRTKGIGMRGDEEPALNQDQNPMAIFYQDSSRDIDMGYGYRI